MEGLTIESASEAEKPVVARLLQLYLHDLSEFDGSEPGDDGAFRDPYLEHYWDPALSPGEQRWPFLIRKDGKLAGFAFIRLMANGRYQMAEFGVLRKHRGTGLALAAATELFRRFAGAWDLTIHPKNAPGQVFWPRAIEAVAAKGSWSDRSNFLLTWHQFDVAGAGTAEAR